MVAPLRTNEDLSWRISADAPRATAREADGQRSRMPLRARSCATPRPSMAPPSSPAFSGFVYWFVAARLAPAAAVGTASAIQSAAQFLGIFCVIGLNTLLISELAADKSEARSLMLTAAAGVGVVAYILSAGVGIGLASLSTTLREGLNGPGSILIFAVLSALTTVLVLLDDACIGLLRGDFSSGAMPSSR